VEDSEVSQLEVFSDSREADAGGTTSASYANTTTLIPATSFVTGKKYLLIARAEISMNQLLARGGIRLNHGATTFDAATQDFAPRDNVAEWSPYFYFVVWQAVAGEQVVIQTKGNGTARCDYRWASLVAIRLDDSGLVENTDWLYDDNTTDITLTTSFVDGAVLTWTPGTGGETWLVMSRSRIGTDFAADEYVTRLDHTGGATENWEMTWGGRLAGDSRSVPHIVPVTLSAASHTFKEQSKRIGTGAATAARQGSALLALRMARFDVASVISTDGHLDVVDTTQYGTQVATVTHNQAVSGGNALVLAQVALDPADTSSNPKYYYSRVQRANVDEMTDYSVSNGGRMHYPNLGSDSPAQVWPWTHASLRSLATGSAAYDLDVSISAAATGRGVKYRRIIVLSLDVTAAPGTGGGGASLTAERNEQKMYLYDYRADRRRVRIRMKDAAGAAITTAAGTQGAISKGGAAFTTTGVGVLVAEESSNGLYYAELTAAALNVPTSYRFRVTASSITETVTFQVEELPWIYDGLAAGGGANYVDLTSPPTLIPPGSIVRILDGPGAGESMLSQSWSTPRVTMESTWITSPTSSSYVLIAPGLPHVLPDVSVGAINRDVQAAVNLAAGAGALGIGTVVTGANTPAQIVCDLPITQNGLPTGPNFYKDRGIVILGSPASTLAGEQAFISGSSVSGANTVLALDPNAALSNTPAVGTRFVVT
jgi:hypothetical protein